MTITGISRKVASLAIAVLLAAGILFANPAPASADCNSTEVYVVMLGDRYNSPTNGCIGPNSWVLLTCLPVAGGFGGVTVGAEVCVALPGV